MNVKSAGTKQDVCFIIRVLKVFIICNAGQLKRLIYLVR